MRSPVPLVLLLFSMLISWVVYNEPWVNVVGQMSSFGAWDGDLKGYTPLPPEGPKFTASVQFSESTPKPPNEKYCSVKVIYFDPPADQQTYKTYQKVGNYLSIAQILCWVVFVFFHRQVFARFSLRDWLVTGFFFLSSIFLLLI